MYYYEMLDDGTAIGLYDGAHVQGEIEETRFWEYHENVARREHPNTRGHLISESMGTWPLRAIDNARIRTALISTYRVHSTKYFHGGPDFPKMWEPREAKVNATERFSPPGTLGFYFGITIDAALDEAHYYAGAQGDIEKDGSKLILVHRTYFDDILYLAPALPAVWEYLGLPKMPMWEMYIAIMNPSTANEITNTIGIWARDYGFKGIVYPSARYGQNLRTYSECNENRRFPILNFVEIGSHLCEQGIAMQLTMHALVQGLAEKPSTWPPMVVYSEPNIVVFDERAVAGIDRPVFYTTYPLREAGVVRRGDERLGLKHTIEFSYDTDNILIFVNDPKFKFAIEYPR